MCQITAPPTVFLAGPLQAPGWWLFIAGFLAVVTWSVPYNYRKYLPQQPSALYRRVGRAMLGGALLLVWTGAALLALVVIPSTNALVAWERSQFLTLSASHCAHTGNGTAYTTLLATSDRHYGPIVTLQHVAIVFLFVGFGVELIWWFWLARRPRAQPARQ